MAWEQFQSGQNVDRGSSESFASPGATYHSSTIPVVVKVAVGCMTVSLLVTVYCHVWSASIATFQVLIGLVRRNRLAWQWGAEMGLLVTAAGVIASFYKVMSVLKMPRPAQAGFDKGAWSGAVSETAIVVLMTILWIVIVGALNSSASKQFFRLHCPKCKRFTSKAADWAFNQAKCESCDIAF
jgi:hypothetical protein